MFFLVEVLLWFPSGQSCFFISHTREAGDEQYTRGQPCWTASWREQLYGHCFFPLLIRAPHSPVTPPPRLLKTPKDPIWAALESERNHGYTYTHIHTKCRNSNSPHLQVGFLAGKAPLSVHQSQEDMGEVRAWQIQGIIRPLSSLQLSLTRLVGEDEGNRREFMTYPCNHRGGLSHSEIKHMGGKERSKWKRWGKRRKMKDILWRWEKVNWRGNKMLGEGYMLQMLSFDCKNHGRLVDICWFPLKALKKCFIFVPVPFKNDQR